MPITPSYETSYIRLVNEVATYGNVRETRAGPTRSIFGTSIKLPNISTHGFPILTTRKMHPKGVWGELAAFLQGATYLQTFKNLGCNYWDANAAAWPENDKVDPSLHRVGKIYGGQWLNFYGVNQLEELLRSLERNPTSRRHLLTTYNPAELDLGCLPPCHLLAQFQVREPFLDCCVYMRSVDLCLGLPTDIVLYATLMHLIAAELDLRSGELTFMMGDTHIYENHLELWETQANRRPYKLPTLVSSFTNDISNFHPSALTLQGYQHHDAILYPFNV